MALLCLTNENPGIYCLLQTGLTLTAENAGYFWPVFLFFKMNTSELVSIKTATVKKTRTSKRRKDTSQVCRCTRASSCFWYLKRHLCLWVGADELTGWHLKMFVFVWPAGRFGAGCKPSIPPSACLFMQTEGDRNELQQQKLWVLGKNTDLGNPKGI